MAKGASAPKPQYSVGADIVGGLKGPLSDAIQNQILNPDASNALTQRTIQLATQAARSGYGARGMADSGIAQAGEQQAATDAALKADQQQAQNVTQVLSAASGSPTYAPQATPKGFMGLK